MSDKLLDTREPFVLAKSALAYVEKLRAGKSEDEALRAARRIWEGDDFQTTPPESMDVYYQMAFRDTDPLDVEFTATAATVFAPLFAHARREAGEGPESERG